jgi:hypothetical protein
MKLASREAIGVYPVVGWWKENSKLNRSAGGCRYSLIVTIETPPTDIDIFVPVENLVLLDGL